MTTRCPKTDRFRSSSPPARLAAMVTRAMNRLSIFGLWLLLVQLGGCAEPAKYDPASVERMDARGGTGGSQSSTGGVGGVGTGGQGGAGASAGAGGGVRSGWPLGRHLRACGRLGSSDRHGRSHVQRRGNPLRCGRCGGGRVHDRGRLAHEGDLRRDLRGWRLRRHVHAGKQTLRTQPDPGDVRQQRRVGRGRHALSERLLWAGRVHRSVQARHQAVLGARPT